MRKIGKIGKQIFVLAVMTLSFGCTPKLDSNIQKVSYTLGFQYGQNLSAQNVEFDKDALAAGINEALAHKPSRLTPDEMQESITKLREEVAKKNEKAAPVTH